MSIQEIEAAIKALPQQELAHFDEWYRAFHEKMWDAQMVRDLEAGKLDFLLDEAKRERADGTLRRFP